MGEKVSIGDLSPTPRTIQKIFGGKLPHRLDPLVKNKAGEIMSWTIIYDETRPVIPPGVVNF